jgi:hypothetical protein
MYAGKEAISGEYYLLGSVGGWLLHHPPMYNTICEVKTAKSLVGTR